MTFKQWLADTKERALTTLLQVFVMFLGINVTVGSMGWWKPFASAGLTTLFNIALALCLVKLKPMKNYLADVVVRMMRLFISTIAGALTADGLDLFQFTAWRTAWLAGLAVVTVALKGEIAKWLIQRKKQEAIEVKGVEVKPISPASLAMQPTNS